MIKTSLLLTITLLFMSAKHKDTPLGPVANKTTDELPRLIKIDTVIRAPAILGQANLLYELSNKNDDDINIIINSPGGGVFEGLQFINAMEVAKERGVKLKCYVNGMAASMAFQILAHCNERYAMPYSLLLFHPVRIQGPATLTPLAARQLLSYLQGIENKIVSVLLEQLKIKKDVFFFHYLNETMFTAISLNQLSPGFLTITTEMPVSAKAWNVRKVESKKKALRHKNDCLSCHKKHGNK